MPSREIIRSLLPSNDLLPNKDHSSTSSPNRFPSLFRLLDEIAQGLDEMRTLGDERDRGGFSAGDDERIDASEMNGRPDFDDFERMRWELRRE